MLLLTKKGKVTICEVPKVAVWAFNKIEPPPPPPPQAFAYSNPSTVSLGTVSNFAAFAAAAISDTGAASVITGDVGLTPGGGSSITVLTCGEITGKIYETDSGYAGGGGCVVPSSSALLTTARNDLNTAYNDAAGRTPNITLNAGDNQLGGQTLTPGVYAVAAASTANIIGTLTLDGGGDSNAVFIFQMPSTLVTASSSKVVLTNGAQACNVFWQVGSSVTLNSSSTFVGNVLANATIVDSGSSTVNGRLLAGAITGSGALTLEHTTITKSTCASTSSTSSSTSSSTGGAGAPCIAPLITTVPIIIESKRISPTSISVSWGPYAGIDTFNVRYGLINGTWLYNTNVTGFSTTINALPPNQPIWIEVAATNSCSIGTYGVSKLVGEPSLPNTGLAPRQNNIPWYIPAGIGVTLLTLLVLIQRKYRFFV